MTWFWQLFAKIFPFLHLLQRTRLFHAHIVYKSSHILTLYYKCYTVNLFVIIDHTRSTNWCFREGFPLLTYGVIGVLILAADIGCRTLEHQERGIRALVVGSILLTGYAFSQGMVIGAWVASLVLTLSVLGYLLGQLVLRTVDAHIMKTD